jgi:hypothetical protein
MTPQLHTVLNALIDRFYREELTEEEWALLQVHMAYCGRCEKEFVDRQVKENTDRLELAAREGREARAKLG